MPTILDKIVAERRIAVKEAKGKRKLSELEDRAKNAPFHRSLAGAFPRKEETLQLTEKEPHRIIAEIKKASPSKGLLRADFHPKEIAESYEENGARAISVLTEEAHFQGSLDHLTDVAHSVSIPVLRKDFFVDPYQVVEARAFGASAILIIAACTPRSLAGELLAAAKEFSLDVLAEVHTLKELDEILSWDKEVLVGINNRDLHSFNVNLETSLSILPHVPAHFRAISESGLGKREDLNRLREAGAGGFLIGESFMKEKDPGKKLAELVGGEKPAAS
ncbi:MAG: indole-3-glycerol phosphate synthase TrpC [Bdellovibrionota bacterium]